MTTRLQTAKRREKVFRSIAKGLTIREIAELHGVTVHTIDKDIQALKDRLNSEIEKKDISSILLMIKSTQESTLRELWYIYGKAKQESTKLGCMNQINHLIDEKIGLMQRLGLIDRAPDEIIITSGDEIASKMEELYANAKQLHETEEDNSGDASEDGDSEASNEDAVSE